MKMSRNLWLLVQGFIEPQTFTGQHAVCMQHWSYCYLTFASLRPLPKESFSTLCWVSFLILFVIYVSRHAKGAFRTWHWATFGSVSMINSGVFVPLSPLAGKSEVKFVKQMRKKWCNWVTSWLYASHLQLETPRHFGRLQKGLFRLERLFNVRTQIPAFSTTMINNAGPFCISFGNSFVPRLFGSMPKAMFTLFQARVVWTQLNHAAMAMLLPDGC